MLSNDHEKFLCLLNSRVIYIKDCRQVVFNHQFGRLCQSYQKIILRFGEVWIIPCFQVFVKHLENLRLPADVHSCSNVVLKDIRELQRFIFKGTCVFEIFPERQSVKAVWCLPSCEVCA